jgi:hypothetical protein
MRKEKEPDRHSISALGGWTWTQPVPDADDSEVVRRSYALHRIPIGQLSAADLRFLIGQNECLRHLVPKALALLETDPWMETEFYPGDLLSVLVRIDHPADFWSAYEPLRVRLAGIARRALDDPPQGVERALLRLVQAFA